MAGAVFISYRRADSDAVVGRIHDTLLQHIPSNRIFRDLDRIAPGELFPDAVRSALATAQVTLVIIGPRWVNITRREGVRHVKRLDDASDWVRMEVERSLAGNGHVIPVLVSGASLPKGMQLPPSMRQLVTLQAVHVRSDPDFHRDMGRLLDRLLGLGISMDRMVTSTEDPITITGLTEMQGGHLTEVWVYAPQPLETLASVSQRALRKRVFDNMVTGVKYVYFVDGAAGVVRIQHMLRRMASELGNDAMIERVLLDATTVVVLSPEDFLTHYTVHFHRTGALEVLQSDLHDDRNDGMRRTTDIRAEKIREALFERMRSRSLRTIDGLKVYSSA